MSSAIDDFQVGDLVKFSRVFRVTHVNKNGLDGVDEKSGVGLYFSSIGSRLGGEDATRYELLHRPTPKPAVGSVLSSQKIRDTMWRRGTILLNDRGASLTLRKDGTWLRSDGESFEFEDFWASWHDFTLIYLPEEK